MAISDILGTHVLNNAWMNSDADPATNAPAHAGLSQVDIFDLGADTGADVVRIPLSLRDAAKQADGTYSLPTWQIDAVIRPILEDAAGRQAAGQPVKIILELGETPAGVAANDFATIAGASKAFVDAVYTALPSLKSLITAWEIGNEPNEIHIGLYREKPYDFADYVSAVANALTPLEGKHGVPIDVVGGAIAYNDYDYMSAVFDRLGSNPNIDGFAVHPYTYSPIQAQVDGPAGSPDFRSKRPTDWTDASGRQDDNDFQGAVYNLQQLMTAHGYGGKGLWITEVGVTGWTGFRNPGPDGRNDQGRWIAEAFGVLDSWDNPNLKSVVIHSTVDYQPGYYNDQFSIFDGNPDNNNDGSDGESTFGLFERNYDGGPIVAKPAAYVFSAMQGILAPEPSHFPEDLTDVLDRLGIVVGSDLGELIDLSGRPGGSGFTNGWISLGKSGNDSLSGSAFDDSLFGGNGTDTIRGNGGDDRTYGGAGDDTLYGDAGDDDLYGNTGDDTINAGTGSNRVDGGTGRDTLVLEGRARDYQITGDGRQVTVNGLGETTKGENLERLFFIGDGSERLLANADTGRGNGLGGVSSRSPPDPTETLYRDIAATQWLTGTTSSDVFVVDAASWGYHAGPTLDGKGIVVWNGAKFDILTGFETLRFTDKDVKADADGRFDIAAPAPQPGDRIVSDVPDVVQHLTGTAGVDVFRVTGNAADYGYGKAEDGVGAVVWKGLSFDVLHGFETISFSDRDVAISTFA